MKKIAVIGAGISGLTCAYELQKRGFNVKVFEKENEVGGRMRTYVENNIGFDIGVDHFCNLYREIKAYCKEFHIDWEKLNFQKYNQVFENQIVSLKTPLSLLEKLKLNIVFFSSKQDLDFFDLSNAAKYDTGDAYSFFQRKIGKKASDYLLDSFVSTYQFHSSKEISVGVLIAVMDSIRHDHNGWELYRSKGGMKALPEAFHKHLDVSTSSGVEEVVARGRNVALKANGKIEEFDFAVISTPAPITKRILKNPTKVQTHLLDGTDYSSTISVAFSFDADCFPDKVGIIWVPYVESKIISGLSNESMKGAELIRGGRTLLCLWLHEEAAKQLSAKADADVFKEITKELLRICPWVRKGNLTPHSLKRWEHAMPKFSEGSLSRVKGFLENKEGQGANGIWLCGDYLNSPWAEGAMRCGQRVAHKIIEKARELATEQS